MIWSQIKKTFESRLAPTLVGKLQIHVTGYKGRRKDGRGWIVFEGQEIVSVQAPGFTMKVDEHQVCLGLFGGAISETGPRHGANTIELGAACGELINSPIASALNSFNPLIKGLAILDKRCGKAKYRKMAEHENHLFVQLMLSIRMKSEGITPPAIYCPNCQKILFPTS